MAVIHVITEYDLLVTKATKGDYYACTDSRRIYKDTTSFKEGRRIVNCVTINTESERVYGTRPQNGKLYYVWETNTLWEYNAGWKVKIGNEIQTSGYYYRAGILTNTGASANIIDNNGLLKDGSVVIRDNNRIVKGKIYIDRSNNNLNISSYLGNSINLTPHGGISSAGSLELGTRVRVISGKEQQTRSEDFGYAWYDGQLNVTDHIYVNLKELNASPSDNPIGYNTLVTEVWCTLYSTINGVETYVKDVYYIYTGTSGNEKYDTTVRNIRTTDIDTGKLYDLDINPGTVIYDTICDGRREIKEDGSIVFTLDNGENTVITISKNNQNDGESESENSVKIKYSLDNDKNKEVDGYSLTYMNIKYPVWDYNNFDPDNMEYNGKNVLKSLQKLETPLDLDVKKLNGHESSYFATSDHEHNASDINGLDDYVYSRIKSSITGGNKNGISVTYDSKDHVNFDVNDFIIKFEEVITKNGKNEISNMGQGFIRDLSDTTIRLDVNPLGHVHNIDEITGIDDKYVPFTDTTNTANNPMSGDIATTKESGKIVYTSDDGSLPVNIKGRSSETYKLSHPIDIRFLDNVTGKTIGSIDNIDFSGNLYTINIGIDSGGHSHSEYIKNSRIGINGDYEDSNVAPLVNGIVPDIFLPSSISEAMHNAGTFDPKSGYPANPRVGAVYKSVAGGIVNGLEYYIDDFAMYDGNSWNIISGKRYGSLRLPIILYSVLWDNNIYNLLIDITETTIIELYPDPDITDEQFEALQSANIIGGTQSAGSIQLKAMGDVPTMDIPIFLVIRRD